MSLLIVFAISAATFATVRYVANAVRQARESEYRSVSLAKLNRFN